MRVYRAWRDDGYLANMLGLLQELQVGTCSCPF
jgi:hypothetical protein